jgi:uncharacterized damage-inducible protein DinB
MNKQQLATLENSRAYTLAVATAMPEKSYEFKPTETVWSFRELMHHIAYGIQWWKENHVLAQPAEWNPPVANESKDAIASYLNVAYDELRQTLEKGKLSEKAMQGFYATLDHITHHRGQGVTYLQAAGIQPPEYTY